MLHIKVLETQVQCETSESFSFKHSKENLKLILNGHYLDDVCECLECMLTNLTI